MKNHFVSDIRERDWVDSIFLVREKTTAMAKNGKPYLTLKLMDRSGEVEARVWDQVDDIASRFERDDFVQVKGKASVYLNKMQLIVQELSRIEEDRIDMADFLPTSSFSRDQLLARLRERVAGLEDPHLKALMESFLADGTFLERYLTAPAAKSMHHVYLGGLLEHSLAITDLVDDVCGRYPELNRDLILVGALLHDVGKTTELNFSRSFDYTDEGKLIGHIVIGVEMVEEKIRLLEDFPRELAIHLKHLLLSHHGQYEYGSPKRPKTLEAVVLSYLDDLDSKINGIRLHMEREAQNESAWTSYHRLYDRYFYKGETLRPAAPAVAPPAANEPPPAPGKDRSQQRQRHSDRPLGVSLGDQLKGLNLSLFTEEDKSK